MAANDNPNALRFLDSMAKHGEQKPAEKFAKEHALAQATDSGRVFEWAKNLCAFLEENYDDEKIRTIRMDCACGPVPGDNAQLRSLYEKETDPRVFVEETNKLNAGFSLEYDGEAYYLIYPECYCPCVNSNPEPVSRTWCYCTVGYSRRMFEEIFGTEVEAELVNSIKTGAENCRIRIRQKKDC